MSSDQDWVRLVELEEDELWRGTVFRFPASYPFEDVVDFMLFADPASDSGFSILCATGSKAGLLEIRLPPEATPNEETQAVSARWLAENWQKWVCPESNPEDVFVIPNYPEPESVMVTSRN